MHSIARGGRNGTAAARGRFISRNNSALSEDIRRFCGSREKDKLEVALRIAKEGTSDDIFCALVFGRFDDQPPHEGPYRTSAKRFLDPQIEDILVSAYCDKIGLEIDILRGFAAGAKEAGERAAASREEKEFMEVKASQMRLLRSSGVPVGLRLASI
jgi:hypothetical protein